jgi:hypothetical protein
MTTQTILQYNGVRLQNCQTLSFIETPELDDARNYKFTKTKLKVVGYFTLDDHATLGIKPQFSEYPGNGRNKGSSQQFSALRQFLEMPRRRLIYSTLCTGSVQNQIQLGANAPFLDPAIGTPLFVIEPAKSDLVDNVDAIVEMNTRNDVHGGPYPVEVNVTHVANNHVWKVEFSVEFATIPQCINNSYVVDGDSINPNSPLDSQSVLPEDIDFTNTQRQFGVLGHRWSCIDRINDNGYTTRTYTGSVSLANPNWNPNDFRAITVPPIVPGMMRKAIEYVASEDNLTLRYSVTDEEVTVTAPDPARNIHISHNESALEFGSKVHFTVRVTMSGDRNCRLYDLMQLGHAIVEQRLYLDQALVKNTLAACLIRRWDYTSEQGTDQNHSMTLVVSGERHAIDQANPNALNRAQTMSRSLCWRPVRSNVAALLSTYNNVLSRGNRLGEQPDTEGGIPAISILHTFLTTPCTTTFGASGAVSTSEEVTQRIRRIDDLEESQPDYDTESMYQAYPAAVTVEINDNVANGPVLATYSTQHATFFYSHYNITTSYGLQTLNIPLPVAQTYGYNIKSNVLVSIGPRQPTRKIRIEAERVGSPPRLPEPVASFTESSAYVPGGGSQLVTNTLISSKVQHLNPAPVADGQSLMYTSYLDLDYSQDLEPAKHRFGIPDYIQPTTSGGTVDSLTDTTKYNFALSDIFVASTLGTTWNT